MAYGKRRRSVVGEEMHEATSFLDSRVTRREIEQGGGEGLGRGRFSRVLLVGGNHCA